MKAALVAKRAHCNWDSEHQLLPRCWGWWCYYADQVTNRHDADAASVIKSSALLNCHWPRHVAKTSCKWCAELCGRGHRARRTDQSLVIKDKPTRRRLVGSLTTTVARG